MNEAPPRHPTANQAFNADLEQVQAQGKHAYGQGQAEWDAYLASRPTKDTDGMVQSPDGTTFDQAYADDYFEHEYAVADRKDDQQVAYEDMTPSQLARKLAEADFHGDKTTHDSIDGVLHTKLDELDDRYYSERDDSSTRFNRNRDESKRSAEELKRKDEDDGVNHNDLRSDNLWERVLKVYSRELQRLGEEQEAEAGPTDPSIAPDAGEQPGAAEDDGDAHEDDTTRLPRIEADQASEGDAGNAAENDAGGGSAVSEGDEESWFHGAEPKSALAAEEAAAEFQRGKDQRNRAQRFIYSAPRRMKEAALKASDKVAEKAWNLRARTAYLGGIALINTRYAADIARIETRYHAGNAADLAREGAEVVADKARAGAAYARERTGDAAAQAAYLAALASIEAAYHGGNAAAFVREHAEDAAIAAADKAKAGAANVRLHAEDAAIGTVIGTGIVTRKVDNAGNAAMIGAAEKAAAGAKAGKERARSAKQRVAYMGRALLDRVVDTPADLGDFFGLDSPAPSLRRREIRWEEPRVKRQKPADRKLTPENYRIKDWEEDFDWVD